MQEYSLGSQKGRKKRKRKIAMKEFVELVKEMRSAQKSYYQERKVIGAKVAYKNMINKEYKVDKWLEENV